MNTDLLPPLVRGLVSVPLLSAGDNSRVRTKWGEYRDQVAFRVSWSRVDSIQFVRADRCFGVSPSLHSDLIIFHILTEVFIAIF